MDTIQFVVEWNTGTKEDCCGMCRDIAADNDDVRDIVALMEARPGTCAWCEASQECDGDEFSDGAIWWGPRED
jgi:hypothetical protein